MLSGLTAETGQCRRVHPHTRSILQQAANRKTADPSGFMADVEDWLVAAEECLVGEHGEAASSDGWLLSQDRIGSAETKADCDQQFQQPLHDARTLRLSTGLCRQLDESRVTITMEPSVGKRRAA